MGGAISRVPDDATALTGRRAAWWISAEAMWCDTAHDEPHRDWTRRTMAAFKPFTTVGKYVNDAVESDIASVRAIYGDVKYDKTAALKRKYDPDNFFRLNLNVRP